MKSNPSQLVQLFFIWIVLPFCGTGLFDLDSAKLANLSECDTNSYAPRVAAGKLLELCCLLQGSICDRTLMNDSLTLTPCTKCSQSYMDRMSREGPCLVKYRIEQASLVDEMDYHCQLNGRSLGNIHLQIIEAPDPKIVSIVCSPSMYIIITIDMGQALVNYSRYTVQVVLINGSLDSDQIRISSGINGTTTAGPDNDLKSNGSRPQVTLCNGTVSSQEAGISDSIHMVNKTTLICEYMPSGQQPSSHNFSIVINVSLGRIHFNDIEVGTYNFMNYICPEPVIGLTVQNVSAVHANITFELEKKTALLHGSMRENINPLVYHVKLMKTADIPELLLAFSFVSSATGLCGYPHVTLHLSNLTANRNYTLIVSTSGGGGESGSRTLTFLTTKTAPLEPPKASTFNFWRNKTSDGPLLLLWQPLPPDARGGNDLTYSIELTSDSAGFQRTWTNISETFLYIQENEIPAGSVTARLWACNEIGRTVNFSSIEIPARIDTVTPVLIVEQFNNKIYAYVYLTDPSPGNYQQAMWLWCTQDQENGFCQDYQHETVRRPVNLTERGIWQVELMMDKSLDHAEVMEDRTVYIKETGECGSVVSNVTAAVRLYTAEEELIMTEKLAHQTDDTAIVSDLVHTTVTEANLHLKVFVSVKYKNLWSGMVPASCYFDRTSEEVQVNLTVCATGQKKDKISVCVKQTCDSAGSKQFLVYNYKVATSEGYKCSQEFKMVENPIFWPAEIEVARSSKLVCVKAYRHSSPVNQLFSLSINSQAVEKNSMDSNNVFTEVIATSATLTGVIYVAIVACYCHRRKKRFEHLKVTGRSSIMLPGTSPSPVPHCHINIVTVNDSTTDIPDSGHGTNGEYRASRSSDEIQMLPIQTLESKSWSGMTFGKGGHSEDIYHMVALATDSDQFSTSAVSSFDHVRDVVSANRNPAETDADSDSTIDSYTAQRQTLMKENPAETMANITDSDIEETLMTLGVTLCWNNSSSSSQNDHSCLPT